MFLLTLLHKSEICLPNFKSESIVIPIRFSHELDVIHALSRNTSKGFFVLYRIWHLSGLTFIWLLVNQEKTLLAVDCSCVITLGMSPVQEYGVVLSAELAISESSHSKKRSIISMLNSNGHKIEPCGTPFSILLLSL